MTRRKALIKALIHFHYRSSGQSFAWKTKPKKMAALRTKIAEPDQYGIDR